jgi:hypothetical protein
MSNIRIASKIVLAKLEKEIEKAKKADLPSVFLGGLCDDDNEWRQKLKKEFKDKLFFIDPYDPDWNPEENIYDELAAIINADYTVFYKGGKGSEREQWFMNQSDREYADFDDLDKLRAYLERLAEPVMKRACISEYIRKFAKNLILRNNMIRTADYPDHPDDLVLPKSDWSSRTVNELDVWTYYSGAGNKMLPELKGRNLFIGIVPKGYKSGQKPIYVRHPYHGNTEYIRIGNAKEFEIYHSGRTVEYHVTLPKTTPYYIIDIDAPGKFSNTKKITAEVADALGKLSEVKKTEIRYTGKRGFHLLFWLKKSRDVDDARNFLKEWLKKTFGDRDDVVLGESPKGDKPALGLSPMKLNGGQVALWSLRVSGLCCVEVPRAQLMSFEREDASIEKTYKKLTGKTFSTKKADYNIGPSRGVPTTKIKELPGAHLERPMVKAIKALINENTVSSGWHHSFSKEFNDLDPCWAIIFQGPISNKIKKAAESAGLKVKARKLPIQKDLTDVYLPGVAKADLEKATEAFDKFALEYEKLSKKTASILLKFINGESIIVPSINSHSLSRYSCRT